MLYIGLCIGLAAYAAVILVRCSFRVQEGHLAVLTTFGAAECDSRQQLRTYRPGLHVKKPWQKVVIVRMMEQSVDLSGEEGGRSAMADDGTVLRFDSILRYVPVEAHLHQFLFGLRSPIDHITGLFTCLLRNEIANFRPPVRLATSNDKPTEFDFATQAGSYALIRRERKLLNEHIEAFSREQIGNRYGVQFNAVDLTDVLPPDELADALNAVINAQTDAEARYFRAEAECKQRLVSAERGVEIARSRAQATATEIVTIGAFLEDLAQKGTLDAYVARRNAEVLSDSGTLFLKEGS
jgi:regulator of protease activity HflC (stomatin/prohibitin superfamily)